MKIKLHHINLATQNVSRMKHFYKNILFLDDVVDDLPTLDLPAKQISGKVTGGNAYILLAAAMNSQLLANSNRPVSKSSMSRCEPRFS